MAYVSRAPGGKINGVYANPQPGFAEEELADDNSEVVAFLTISADPQHLSQSAIVQASYRAKVQRKADVLAASGDTAGALQLYLKLV
jgi:hypothetical protein